MASANSKDLYIPLSTIYGRKNGDGTYTLTALDIKNLNDNLYAIAKKIQGGLTLADLTGAANTEFNGKVSIVDLATGGATEINGANITTGSIDADLITTGTLSADRVSGGVLQGVTILSDNPLLPGYGVLIDNGTITLGQSIDGGTLEYDGSKVYLRSGFFAPLKLEAGTNMSIDSGGTIYIGSSAGYSGNVQIGQAGGEVRLRGDVYINGVLQ